MISSLYNETYQKKSEHTGYDFFPQTKYPQYFYRS